MSPEQEALAAEIAKTVGVMQSATTLIQGLSQRVKSIQEELAQAGVDNAALNQLSTDLTTGEQTLAEAVAANPA